MNENEETPRKGLIVATDDLNVGEFYTVVGCKLHDNPVPIAGLAFQATAINMPFMVGKLVSDPNSPAVTFDLRYLNLMRVDMEYVKAQLPSVMQTTVMTPDTLLNLLRSKS
jgi:hypothetical protein